MIALSVFVASLSLIALLFLLRTAELKLHFAFLPEVRRKLDDEVLRQFEHLEEMQLGLRMEQLFKNLVRRAEHDIAVVALFFVRIIERKLVLLISAIRGRRRIEKKESSAYIKTITEHRNGLRSNE